MIVAWMIVTAVWASLIMAFDLSGLFLPDLVLALAIWAGLRAFRQGQDLQLVLATGLVQGLFSVEPWLMPSLLGLLALAIASRAQRVLAPEGLFGRILLCFVAAIVVALLEILLRMSVPSLNLRTGLLLGLTARAAASALLAVVLDGLAPRR